MTRLSALRPHARSRSPSKVQTSLVSMALKRRGRATRHDNSAPVVRATLEQACNCAQGGAFGSMLRALADREQDPPRRSIPLNLAASLSPARANRAASPRLPLSFFVLSLQSPIDMVSDHVVGSVASREERAADFGRVGRVAERHRQVALPAAITGAAQRHAFGAA